jgi:protein HOOK3
MRFIKTECDGLDPLLETPGLKTVAEHGMSGQIFEVTHCYSCGEDAPVDFIRQILTILLMVAVVGPDQDRERHVRNITKLDGGVQREIAQIIQQKQQEIENASIVPSNSRPVGGAPPPNDYELEFEVRYSDLIAQKKNAEQEKERLKKQNADLTTRLERLQDNNDHLQERLTAAEDGLSGASRDKDASAVIKGLEAKIREQDDLIASQEGQFEQDRHDKANMRKEIDRLKHLSDQVVQLQDEIKELRYQNAELTKKANTLDRYKQKLESQRDFQTDIKSLELDNEELRLKLKEFELLKHRNESLEATHAQFESTMGRREMEIFELSSQKKILDEEKADLQRALTRLEERRVADEKHLEELQEQLVDRSQSVASPVGVSMGNLEDELEQTQSGKRSSLEVSRLRAENRLLKRNVTAAQDAVALRIQLEEEERMRKREQAKYNELYEKHVITSQQVTAILEASTSEGLVKGIDAAMLIGRLELLTPEFYSTEAFATLRKSYLHSTEKLSVAENRIHELETDLESTKRELLSARNDCKFPLSLFLIHPLTIYIVSMIEQEEIDALEELKATQEALASSIEMELKKLQSRYKDLQIDNAQQKSQLIEALLSKDKLQQTINDIRAKAENKPDDSHETQQVMDKTLSDLKVSQEVSQGELFPTGEWMNKLSSAYSELGTTMTFEPFSEVNTTKSPPDTVLGISETEELARERALFANKMALPSKPQGEMPLPMSVTHSPRERGASLFNRPAPIPTLKQSYTYTGAVGLGLGTSSKAAEVSQPKKAETRSSGNTTWPSRPPDLSAYDETLFRPTNLQAHAEPPSLSSRLWKSVSSPWQRSK